MTSNTLGQRTSDAATQRRNPNRLFLAFLISIPIVWAFGIAPLVGICFAAVFFFNARRWNKTEFLLIALCVSLSFSLAVAAYNGESTDRIVAAGYNIVVIIAGICAFSFGRQLDFTFLSTPRLSRAALIIFFVYFASIAISYLAASYSPSLEIAFPSLLMGQIGRLPGILDSYALAQLTGVDWGNDAVAPRPFGFGVYSNEGALMYVLTGLIGLTASRSQLVRLSILACTAVGLLLLGSRMLILASVVAGAIGILAVSPLARGLRVFIALALLSTSISISISHSDLVDSIVDQLVESRGSSSSERFLSYSTAIESTWSESPAVGLGIKPRDDTLMSIPVGSHSTVVSIFTKGGIVAVTILLVFLVSCGVIAFQLMFMTYASGAFRVAQVVMGSGVLLILSWMLTEDIDAPIYGALTAFAFLGASFGLAGRLQLCEKVQRATISPT